MADDPSTPVMVRLTADQLSAVDDWRRTQPDIPSRPEAIRRLTEAGLAAQPKRGVVGIGPFKA